MEEFWEITMEEETWETGTWEPYAEGRRIAIIQRIRDNRTGEIRG